MLTLIIRPAASHKQRSQFKRNFLSSCIDKKVKNFKAENLKSFLTKIFAYLFETTKVSFIKIKKKSWINKKWKSELFLKLWCNEIINFFFFFSIMSSFAKSFSSSFSSRTTNKFMQSVRTSLNKFFYFRRKIFYTLV